MNSMRSILNTTVAVLCLPLSTAMAETALEPAIQGEIQIGGSFIDNANGTSIDDSQYPGVAGGARMSLPFADRFSFQADIEGVANFLDRGDGNGSDAQGDEGYHGHALVAGHWTWRAPESGAAGVFVAGGSADGGEDEGVSFWLVGAEGQLYLADTTLYAQAGYFEGDDEDERDAMTEAGFVRVVVRHFLSENQRLAAEGSFAAGKPIGPNDIIGGEDDLQIGTWEARYDHGIPDTPVTLYLGYSGMDGERIVGGDRNPQITEHSVFAGFTVTLGYGSKLSLKANDRRGATLDTPDIGRWSAYPTELIDE